MAEHTPIEWTDHTWSPWEGCTQVSPACDHCYAARMNRWLKAGENWGSGAPRLEYGEDHWDKPVRWNAKAQKTGRTVRVFPSVCDPFDNEVRVELLVKFLRVVMETESLTWLLLTKRIGIVRARLQAALEHLDADPETQADGLRFWIVNWLAGIAPENVWLGATVVTQLEADRDVPKLLQVPARVRFLSVEPMLELLRLRVEWIWPQGAGMLPGLHWVICGGESGPGARPMRAEWAQSLRDQCQGAGVAFLFKQWGEWLGEKQDGAPEHEPLELNGSDHPVRVGKKAAGRLLDGRTHDEFPR